MEESLLYQSRGYRVLFSNSLPLFLKTSHSRVLVPFAPAAASSIKTAASSSILIDDVEATIKFGIKVFLGTTPPGRVIVTSK
jgi:hypothetical protein